MKYAVYVEGKAELLFVADILAKYSNYDQSTVSFQCINLNSDDWEYVQYPIQGDGSTSSEYYQIVNVNNDGRVISKLKKDIPNLVAQGFNIIIGLRDVFSDEYKELCDNQSIDMNLINEMHAVQSEQLNIVRNADIRLHYAIMEYETWMMALMDNFVTSRGGNLNNILTKLGIDPQTDFEKTIFHPYNKIQEVYRAVNAKYGKHEADHLSFLSSITITDYEELRYSGKCSSFKAFMDSLGVKNNTPS